MAWLGLSADKNTKSTDCCQLPGKKANINFIFVHKGCFHVRFISHHLIPFSTHAMRLTRKRARKFHFIEFKPL